MKRQDKAWALGCGMFGLFLIVLWGGALLVLYAALSKGRLPP